MPTEVHSDDVIRVWLATVDQPIDVQPGTFVDDGTTWRAVSFDGTTVTGPVNQIVLRGIVSTETPDPEPEPEPESNRPVVLYSDDRLRRVAQALTDPNSVESKQWARAMGTRYLDPNYQPHQIDVVDTQQKGQDFNTDSQACHALALRWVLTGHDESGGAALRILENAMNTIFINSNYDGADGKLVASWALPNYAVAMSLMWDQVDASAHQWWADWLYIIGFDGVASPTQRGGSVMGPNGFYVRGKESDQPLAGASSHVGGSLLDYTGGGNWLIGFDYCKLVCSLIIRAVNPDIGNVLLADAKKKFIEDVESNIYHPDDYHPVLGAGYPLPPTRPDDPSTGASNQYDTPGEMAAYWFFSEALARYILGLTEELGRDMSHDGMMLAPLFMFIIAHDIVFNTNYTTDEDSGVLNMLDRILHAVRIWGGFEHECVEEAWNQHGGDIKRLSDGSWTPDGRYVGESWAEMQLGTKYGQPTFSHGGAAADFPSWYIQTVLGDETPDSIVWLTEHCRINDSSRSIDSEAGTSAPMWGNQMILPALMFS